MVEEYGALCALCGKGEDWASNSYWNDKFGMLTVLSQQHAGKALSDYHIRPLELRKEGWADMQAAFGWGHKPRQQRNEQAGRQGVGKQ